MSFFFGVTSGGPVGRVRHKPFRRKSTSGQSDLVSSRLIPVWALSKDSYLFTWVLPKIKKFFNDKKKVIGWCRLCRDKRKLTQINKSQNQRNNITITYSDISEFVYNLLISLENTNEFYENDNVELAINFDFELISFTNNILDGNNKENFNDNKKLYLEIACYIAKFIEEGDSYRWIYKDKNKKKFISVPELHRQIRENELKGYENLTVQQTYFWWFKIPKKMYHRDPDPFTLAKLLLTKLNQEIIVDITIPTPALGFLTNILRLILARKSPNDYVMHSFCPLDLRKQVIDLVEIHYNRHMLLPKFNSEYYPSSQAIWEECVHEMISFCKKKQVI
ncbi:hypothetical protein C2G38_2175478 [Gigaspora rosea]|uniref:Uncharacterized protein n=1 Tax=Gigaspora rosea TaxID=44941 RepID=A0A397VKI6_9GLOM|nr:hypothetical protein C2G38_2175478 [Gigaspora rosea]